MPLANTLILGNYYECCDVAKRTDSLSVKIVKQRFVKHINKLRQTDVYIIH